MRTLAIALLTLGACATQDGKDAYCPSCKSFTDDACAKCGTSSVDVNVTEVDRFWCSTHNLWHDEACAQNASADCCAEKTVKAMEVSSAANTTMGQYCAGCGMFCGPDCPADASGKCAKCGTPTMPMLGKKMAWYQCSVHKGWHDGPCPENTGANCCTKREATLPVVVAQ